LPGTTGHGVKNNQKSLHGIHTLRPCVFSVNRIIRL
jgi:hypothetical protein